MQKNRRTFSILIIIVSLLSLVLCSCDAGKRTLNKGGKTQKNTTEQSTAPQSETEELLSKQRTLERIDEMYPVFDGIMRAMLMTGKEYTTTDSDLTWRAIYVAVTQGVPTHDEYEIYDEEQNICVPTYAISELNYVLFSKSMEVNRFPDDIDYAAYDGSIDSFIFAANDFSGLSTRIIDYSRTEDGILQVNVSLQDDETGYGVVFAFTLEDNQYYKGGAMIYPYCITDVMIISTAGEETD